MSTESTISNFLGMARTAQMGGNYEEALGYYNRVLELDPTIYDAWIGKGVSAGWLSTLANIRIGETLVAFGHAIASAPDGLKDNVIEQVVNEANSIVSAIYSLARNQLVEFAAVNGVWDGYLNQVGMLIDALQQVAKWSPKNITTLENIVHLCKDNIEGYSFRDMINNVPMAHGITPEYERMLRSHMNEASDALNDLVPGYSAPVVVKKTPDACFVVTATMGDFNHPNVTLLRQFRDRWLSHRVMGRIFIRNYYKFGPGIADVIRDRPVLRGLSLFLIVKPSAWVAKKLLS